MQRTFKESSPTLTTLTKFTKTVLLIYCLNQTFVVTVLTTIFVSDFPLLTKVLTDFVHPPTLLTLFGTQLKNHFLSPIVLTTAAKTALAPNFPTLPHVFTNVGMYLSSEVRGLPYQTTYFIFIIERLGHLST